MGLVNIDFVIGRQVKINLKAIYDGQLAVLSVFPSWQIWAGATYSKYTVSVSVSIVYYRTSFFIVVYFMIKVY